MKTKRIINTALAVALFALVFISALYIGGIKQVRQGIKQTLISTN